MTKICEKCNSKFDTKSATRLYCYDCSGDSTRSDNNTRKHQKTILRRNMKLQAIKLLGGKCKNVDMIDALMLWNFIMKIQMKKNLN